MDQLHIDIGREFRSELKEPNKSHSPKPTSTLRDNPNASTIATLFINATTLEESGEYQLAINLLREIMSMDSTSVQAASKLVECLNEVESFGEAEACCRELLKLHSNADLYKTYADLLYRKGADDEARLAYFQSLKLVAGEGVDLFSIYKNLGNIAVRFGDFDGAEEFYNKAYTLNAASDVLMVNYGTLAIQQGQYERAKERFTQAIGLNQSNDKAWVGLALINEQRGDLELARGNLERAIDANPCNTTALNLLARWSFRDHRFSSVTEALQDYLSRVDTDSELSLLLAKLLVVQRKEGLALLELERLLLWEPMHEEALQLHAELRANAK